MSHFTVLVIGDNPEEQLKPYDESIEMSPYRRKKILKKDIKRFMDTYAKYEDGRRYGVKSKEEAKENRKKTFDQLYKIYGDDWNGKDWKKNRKGEWWEWTTYNPKSKWDWYALGGRWSNSLKLRKYGKKVDQAKKGEINWDAMGKDFYAFAVLKFGEWHEKGKMLWFACVADRKDEDKWQKEFDKLLSDVSDDTLLSIYDCHI